MSYTAVSSKTVKARNKKVVLWGAHGTRKTEAILRHFPNVLLIDIEGNADQCVDMPEIPEFLLIKTKDVDVIREILADVRSGKLKMPNGSPIQTVAIDGYTVLWMVRQEVAANLAEARVAKWNNPSPETADISMREWNIAKRPMKEFATDLANCPVPFLVITAREKDLMVKRPGSKRDDDLVKAGFTMDAMKGLEYEANLVLRMAYEEPEPGRRGDWYCEVAKVQGSLSKTMPIGKRFKTFPIVEIIEHAKTLTGEAGNAESEIELAKAQAAREEARKKGEEEAAAKARFLAEAKAIGYSGRAAIMAVLEPAGMWPYEKIAGHDADALKLLEMAKIAEDKKARAGEGGPEPAA